MFRSWRSTGLTELTVNSQEVDIACVAERSDPCRRALALRKFHARRDRDGLALREGLRNVQKGGNHAPLAPQLLKQRVRLSEDRRAKSFGKPVVAGREKITGFAALALFAPEARKACPCREPYPAWHECADGL
jgi:hypothetical protein